MKYVSIQGIDRCCSQIVMGTAAFTFRYEKDIFRLLDTYLEQGGNTIDTARTYGLEQSELVLALWIKSRQIRKDIIVVNKGCHHYIDKQGVHHPEKRRVGPEFITRDLLESLDRMNVDFFDIYLLHRDDPGVPVDELMDVLQEHKDAGLIKAYGVSNWTTERIEEANRYASRKGFDGIVVNSPSLSLARINEPRWFGCVYADDQYIRWHEKNQMPLLAWASQASGFFAGTIKDSVYSDIVRVYHNAANKERFERAKQLALQRGSQYTANNVALAYVLNQDFPVCAIIGPQRVEHLLESLRAVGLELSEEEMLWISLQNDYRAIG